MQPQIKKYDAVWRAIFDEMKDTSRQVLCPGLYLPIRAQELPSKVPIIYKPPFQKLIYKYQLFAI